MGSPLPSKRMLITTPTAKVTARTTNRMIIKMPAARMEARTTSRMIIKIPAARTTSKMMSQPMKAHRWRIKMVHLATMPSLNNVPKTPKWKEA